MKAYFIGGSLDMTCEIMREDNRSNPRTRGHHRMNPVPVMAYPPSDFPTTCRVITEQYHGYELPAAHGDRVMVYIFEKDNSNER